MSTTRTQTPVPWPDKPLIRIVSGYESGVGPVTDALALLDAAGCYRLAGGGLLVPDTGDVIATWEEMRAIPVYRASEIPAGPLLSEEIQAPVARATDLHRRVCRHTLRA